MSRPTSCGSTPVLPKHRVGALLAAGWARVIAEGVSRGSFADKLDVDENTLGNALNGRTVPSLHTALNSLAVDATALNELLAAYGFKLCPKQSQAANDLDTAAGMIAAMSELVRANADGSRDHNETLALAALLRPLMPAVERIIQDADVLRGAGSRREARA